MARASNAAIVGIGQTEFSKDSGRSELQLACEAIKAALDDAGVEVISADAPLVSDNLVPVTDSGDARSVLRVIEAREDNDDVQDVFSNFDMADDVLEAAAS